MKISYPILAISLCLFFITDAFSQAKEPVKLRFNTFSAQFGFYGFLGRQGGNLKDFKALAPESELLENNFDDFNQSFYNRNNEANPAFSAQLYFDWRTKNEFWNKLNPQLRLGLSYASINLMNGNLYGIDYHRIDTLTSNKNGKTYYVDSVNTENYILDYQAEMLLIDAALMFSSNPNSRWSIYAGMGLSIGMIFGNTAIIRYIDGQYYNSRANYNSTSNHWNSMQKEEVFSNNQLGYAALASLPLGINFRLSKKDNFWGNTSLFAEMRTALSYINTSALGSELSTSRFNMFGIKYKVRASND